MYVDDAFGAAHRAHASTEGAARLIEQRAAGLLLEREVTTLTALLADPARPLVAVLGGSKVSDKIAVIERFQAVADEILIGGAMCFPFLAAQGHAVGTSLCAAEDIELARAALGRRRYPGRVATAGRPRDRRALRRGRSGPRARFRRCPGRLDGARHRSGELDCLR